MPPVNILNELKILDPKQTRLSRDNFRVLKVTVEGDQEYSDVKPVRSFPLSDPEHLIGFADENGDEIGMIEDYRQLDPESQTILQEELKRGYFMPQILKINRMKEEFAISMWDVETDRGPRHFAVREKDDIRKMPGRHVIFRDVDGNLFEIPDYGQLDPRSFSFLESEI